MRAGPGGTVAPPCMRGPRRCPPPPPPPKGSAPPKKAEKMSIGSPCDSSISLGQPTNHAACCMKGVVPLQGLGLHGRHHLELEVHSLAAWPSRAALAAEPGLPRLVVDAALLRV